MRNLTMSTIVPFAKIVSENLSKNVRLCPLQLVSKFPRSQMVRNFAEIASNSCLEATYK